jgi:hypothetical protein
MTFADAPKDFLSAMAGNLFFGGRNPVSVAVGVRVRRAGVVRSGKVQKKLIVIPTTNLALTLKSNTMKNSMQNYKIIFKQCYIT